MQTDIINNLNWIDLLTLAILFRAVYVGVRGGFVIEAFKILGILFAVFITFHYYSGLSIFLQDKLRVPQRPADLFCYGFLWGFVVLIFKLIRDGFTIMFKIEAHSAFDKWGGLIVSIFRGALLCSLALLFLRVSSLEYLAKNLERSLTAAKLIGLSPKVYRASYDNFVSKFFPSEELNQSIFKFAELKEEKK